jgi:hypothetical protein
MLSSHYKKVLKVNRNYNKVLKPDKLHKVVEAFNGSELVGGGSRGVIGACTQVEDRAQ